MYVTDNYVLNGQGEGEVGSMLNDIHFEPGLARPYVGKDGAMRVTIQDGFTTNKEGERKPKYVSRRVRDLGDAAASVPTVNASLALRKDEWIKLDNVVVKAAMPRMTAYRDLRASNTVGGFDGMASTVFEHEVMNDPGKAFVDMDGMTEGQNDSARFQLRGLPLPITHASFSFSARQLATSRRKGQPLDTTRAQAAGEKIGEELERMTIGLSTGLQYGTAANYDQAPQIRGYLTHPSRLTKADLTTPDGTNGQTVVSEILTIRDLLFAQHQFGPFQVYTSTDWDRWLDADFKTNVHGTLRQRIQAIDGINSIKRLDYLDPSLSAVANYTIIFVQMQEKTARAINGMEIRTLQWPSHGGQRINYKVMTIQVPQLRDDYYGHMGLAVGNVAP